MEKLKNIKAVFIDVDGTLTNNKKQILDSTKNSIKRIIDKGIYVVLCSGRSNKDVCKYSIEANTSGYAVSSNGAHIYNYKTDKDFYKNEITKDELIKVWNFCNQNNLELILNGKCNQYGNNIFCSDMYKDKIIVKNINDLENIEIYQIIVNSNDYDSMNAFENYINKNESLKIANYSREYINKNKNSKEPYYIFVNNKETDKGTAITKFLNIMNIKKQDAICFGDRMNDTTMFESCGNTVAMKNADAELKKIANYITLSNDENGVGNFLDNYIL